MCTTRSTFDAAHLQYHQRFTAGYCLQTICISCVFLDDFENPSPPHHLWRDMLTICFQRLVNLVASCTTAVTSCPSFTEATSLLSHTTTHRVPTPRHAPRCLLRQSLHISEHRLRTQLEFLKQHTPAISFRIKGTVTLTSQVSGTRKSLS